VRTGPVPGREPGRWKRPDGPSIAKLLDDPARVAELSRAAARALSPRLAALRDAVLLRALEAGDEMASELQETALPARQLAAPLDDVGAYTTAEFGRRLGKSRAYVAELCRSGRIAAIRKGKDWFIPIAAARAWLTLGGAIDAPGSVTLPSFSDIQRREAGAQVPRPVTVGIRVAPRRPRGHGQEVGNGETRHASVD
jgi:hypothetical protein